MKHLSKVVWHEGMYLGPHHFQVQSQSFEDLVHFSTSSLWFAPYGVISCKLDPDALQNGMLSLVHARGLFPDGLAFQMPDADAVPPILNINELFSSTRESLLVSLAVPARRPDGPNCALDSEPSPVDLRYQAEMLTLPDDNTGRDEKQIQVGRKNIRFTVESQATQDLVTLPVARVLRDGSGRFIFDPSFIPPCLQISASERLLVIARTLVDILDEKSASLSRARRATAQGRAGYSSDEIASFWFVHTVNESLSVLRHLSLSERGHPEQLYMEMSRLAGALCTFGLESHPESLPAYNHDDLGEVFRPSESTYPRPSRACCSIELSADSPRRGWTQFPQRRHPRSTLPRSRALDSCRPRGNRRSGNHRENSPSGESLLQGLATGISQNGVAGLGVSFICQSRLPPSPPKSSFSISA